MALVYLALGSNLGDREASLRLGLSLLSRNVVGLEASSIYETEPWGYADQPMFLNLVCRGEIALPPLDLLRLCQRVEREAGRTPTFRYGPRVLDIDLLDYDGQVIAIPDLALPHPRMAERAFVLVPLAELAPAWVHPALGKTAAQLLAMARGTEGVRLFAPPPYLAGG